MTIKNLHSILIRQLLRIIKGINKPEWVIYLLKGIVNKNVDDFQNLAIAYINVGDSSRALVNMEKAIQKDPNDIFINARIGTLYSKLGYPEKALHYLDKIKDSYKLAVTERGYSNYLAYLGNCHRNLGDYITAAEFYQKSLDLTPYNLDTIHELVEMYKDTAKFDSIVPFLQDLLIKYSDLYPLNAMLANHFHYYLFDLENAIKQYEIVENSKKFKKIIINKYGSFGFSNNIERICSYDYIIALVQADKKRKLSK